VAQIPQIITAILTGLGKAIPAIIDVGKNIARGLWDGIASMVTWLKNKVSDMVGGIVKGVKGILGIRSPSQVFAGIGENMGEGIGVGFEKAMDDVSEDMQKVIPTDFKLDSDVNVNGGAGGGYGMLGGSLITIQQMIVRSEDDIRKISQELYNLMQTGSRAQGRFITT
jgi:hypothetical protein